ncbi:MAG: HAMP domain-containing histidine kinase [Actinobacteria bacterium]|nr:HAMP domain-containing histidine kinase [Actinomycetota bacterium]
MKINLGKYNLIFKKKGNGENPEPDEHSFKNLNTIEFVSHELRGILGSTIMFVYSIRDGFYGFLNFKQRNCIEATIRNLRRLESTIKDFLDLSIIEDKKIDLVRADLIVNEDIIREVLDTFCSEIFEKRIIVKNDIPDELHIISNRNLLTTVFNNLIGNAIKYGNKNGKIIISSHIQEKFIRFSIYNDGTPLADDEGENLFKKFFRLENESNKKIKGTGLGLFIVKNIVGSLGGRVWHEPGEKGNIFIFEIKRS